MINILLLVLIKKEIMMSKRNLVIVVVLVLVVLVVGVLQYKANHANDYSVVYLSTGEVYVGKLSTFPDLQLKGGYILQVTKDPADETKTNFQIQPIAEALWAPKVLHLVKDNIVFYGPLMPTSKIAETLVAQGK